MELQNTSSWSVKIAWWNTSLAPLASYRATAKDRQFAISVIQQLLINHAIDSLALGEITADFLSECVDIVGPDDFSFIDCITTVDRIKFDIGIIYRHDMVRLEKKSTLISRFGDSALKVGQTFDLQLPKGRNLLHLFVVHWPSYQWCHANSAKRDKLGYSLRSAAEEIMSSYLYPAQLMFIGDFNDDPFDQALAGHLLAIRDRSKVRHSQHYFYNPFWRYIGESHPHKPNIKCDSICGTYCQRGGGDESRWRTFDQVIVSHALLNSYEWQLNEEYTYIIRMKPLDDMVRSRKTIFDHLPIMSTIELPEERSVTP
jgi:hypothetical protein